MKNHCAYVVGNKARFAVLADGVVRMEYSATGCFEDRRSVRVVCRPEPLPFESVRQEGDETVMTGGRVAIRFRDDGTPFSKDNLVVAQAGTGETIWRPGQVDDRNLGAVHQAMDVVQRGIIPSGVHAATTDYHANGSDFLLWNYAFDPHGESVPGVHYSGGLQTLEQVLKTRPFDELPPRLRSLLRERSKYPPGLLSRAGYFLFNDSGSPVFDPAGDWPKNRQQPDSLDYYFFCYGTRYREALLDYRTLFGASPLPPRYSLGLWYSRYPTFDEPGLRDLIRCFENHGIPLDVLVLDLEWHLRGWHGFDWDTAHIHDPEGLLAHFREQKIHTTFNVHPGGVPVHDSRFKAFIREAGLTPPQIIPQRKDQTFRAFDLADKRHAVAFMDVLHKPVQQQGVDFWWIDGDAPVKALAVDRQLWTNHVYWKNIQEELPDRRPMIFSRAAGFGSHRYPFHFTGDTYSQWEVLKSQVEFTARAGHIGLSFITHDIGGHMCEFDMVDPELYCRWVQFGALSPMFRLHSSNGGERRPWLYGQKVLESFKTAIRLRMELLPTLYSLARESHATGMPICRSAALARPEWEQGYAIWDSYFLGERIYCAPILNAGGTRDVILPEGVWYDAIQNRFVRGDGRGALPLVAGVTQLPPHYVQAGSVIVKQPYQLKASMLPDTLILECYLDGSDTHHEAVLYEDDGESRAYRDGSFTQTCFSLKSGACPELRIGACKNGTPLLENRSYILRVYGQTISEAACGEQRFVPLAPEGPEAPYQCFQLNRLSSRKEHAITLRVQGSCTP